LHFGTFGGSTTKVIWFAAGVFSSLAILLGVRVWFMRTVPSPLMATRPASVLSSVTVTLLVLGLAVYGCIVNIGDARAHAPTARVEPLGRLDFGHLSLRLSAGVTDGRWRVAGVVLPERQAGARIRRVSMWLGGAEAADIPKQAVQALAAGDGIHAVLESRDSRAASHLWVAVDEGTGEAARAAVSVASIASGTGLMIPHEVVPAYVWIVIGVFTSIVAAVCVGWTWWLPRSALSATILARRSAGRDVKVDTTLSPVAQRASTRPSE
jgi:hypothetical protein